MSTRKPPVAPKAGHQSIGPLEGQQIVLESHTPSPRKGVFSDYGSFGSLRPRSPKPAEVRNAAVAEIEGYGREFSKSKQMGSSPASSPSRRRGGISGSSLAMSTAPLNSLSPRNSNSILDQGGYKTISSSGISGPSPAITAASARVLSALDEHRAHGGCAKDRLYSTAPLPGTPPRKATSAPDSQSAQAQFRTSICPWSNGNEHLLPLQPSPPASVGAMMGHYSSPNRYRGVAPPSPPLVQNLTYPVTAQPAPPPMGHAGYAATSAAHPAPPPLVTGGVRQRRESISSTDSHSPGVVQESPGSALTSSLRVAALARIGSPNSGPSTPSSSQPHTPVSSSLKPKPPPGYADAAAAGRGVPRKMGPRASPDPRRQPQQMGTAAMMIYPQVQQQQQAGGHSPGDERMLMHMATAPVSMDYSLSQPAFLRSFSLGAGGPLGTLTGQGTVPGLPGLSGPSRDGSQPGTPTSASRPGSGRGTRQPVVMLVDAVRTKDEGKLADALEALRGQNGVPLGLNERHPITGRTPLHEAAMTSSTGMVALLLQAGADPNLGHDTQGPPLLHSAAFGDVEVMRLLLHEGADVNAVDAQRETALHLACVGRHVEAARVLTKYGALWSAINEDNQTPVELAPPEFMRLYTYDQSVALSPPYLSRGGGGSRAATAAAAAVTTTEVATAGALYSDPSGVDVAPSPERPSSSASTSAATTPMGRASTAVMLEGGSSKRMVGRPPGGPTPAVACAASTSASVNSSPIHGPPLSPTSQIDLAGNGGGVAAQPSGGATAITGSLRPVPPPEPANAGFRSRRNSGSALGTGGVSAAPGGGGGGASSPPVPTGFISAAAAAAATGNRSGAPASPHRTDSDGMLASPPTLQLPGGIRRQLSRGAAEGDILNAFHAEDAEILRNSMSGPPLAALDGLPSTLCGLDVAAAAAAATGAPAASGNLTMGFFPPFQPPPGLPAGPSAASLKAKVAAHASGDKDTHKEQQQQKQPLSIQGAEQQQFRINVPETSVIRFGVRLQVHGSMETCETPTVASAPTATTTTTTTTTASSTTCASAPTAISSSCLSPADSGVSTATGGAGAAAGDSSATTVARQLSGPITMPSFSAGMAPGLEAAAVTAVIGSSGATEGAAFVPVPATGFTPPPPLPPVRTGSRGTAASRASGSGDESGTPPLMRDSSPVRDLRGFGDDGAQGVGGSDRSGGDRANPQRASILAAKALKKMSPMTASKDAIEARAANMFRLSTDLRTGELEWTQGELIGEGAFGKVYVGLNQQTGGLMAVKVLQLINHKMNKEAALQQLKEMEHETSLYKKLRHKHVVGFIDARYDPETSAYYIFLEFVPGGSISSMLKRFKRFSEELVRNYTRQLLLGLDYLHSCKIVHRDLKGGNVLVSRDGVVKLTDFGASKAYRDQTIKECMMSVRGSVFWMAPEVMRGTGYDRRADIWSLGCTVIEMLSGTHPWPNLDNQLTAVHIIAKTEEGPPRPVNISPEAARFLDRCLQFDPAKRPTTTELLQDPFVAPLPSAPHSEGGDRMQHSF
ncbi:hypothetical protein VaNZ11_001592 [Volvox africanus]|uniref:mitogen-activated protein kinase kinase kinase n=1 Tax=Volvox africanus TaxID=51714 RepID=A0ABQ5RQ18_9CHLO|nr:hypothetical protein VaNZ11_001592 [Volvox africanus]